MCKSVLFIGGNGNISWYCVQKALDAGFDVWTLNRGATLRTRPAIQPEVRQIHCDIRNMEEVTAALPPEQFDCICDFICMNGEEVLERVALFQGRTKQYIFISSDVVYSRKKNQMPFTEEAEQYELSEVTGYIAGKIAAEKAFMRSYADNGFPAVIVRPYFIYSTLLMTPVGRNDFTQAKLILEGKPVLMLGDGNNLVAPMHAEDFANAFVALIGEPSLAGEAFHIANTCPVSWNECMQQFLEALSADNKTIYHIPAEDIYKLDIFKEKELMRQQMGDNVFDCSKIKMIVPEWKPLISYREGIARTLHWLQEDTRRIRVDAHFEQEMRCLYKTYLGEQ